MQTDSDGTRGVRVGDGDGHGVGETQQVAHNVRYSAGYQVREWEIATVRESQRVGDEERAQKNALQIVFFR